MAAVVRPTADGSRIRFRYTGMTTSAAQWWDDVAGTVTRSIGNGWDAARLLDWTGTGSNRRVYTFVASEGAWRWSYHR